MKQRKLILIGLFWSLAAQFAWGSEAELKPDNAFGPANATLPREASQVSEVEFRRMLNQEGLELTGPKIKQRRDASHSGRIKSDENLVKGHLANQPELLKRFLRKPSPNDPQVRPTMDGNYQIKIKNTLGQEQQIITMGDDFLYGQLADTIRNFPGKKNQLDVYTQIYERLPARYRDLKKPPHPNTLGQHTAQQLIALNTTIANDLNNIYIYIPLDPKPAGYPQSCAYEIGNDSRNTDRAGASCSHNASGLFNNATYPMKWYATCVKNQGNRGTCVSFGVTASLETKAALKFAKWLNLSEEDLYNKAKMTWYPSTYGDGLNTAGIVNDIKNRSYVFPYESSWNYNPSFSRVAHPATHTYSHSCDGYTGIYCSNTNHQGKLVCSTISIFGHSYTFCGYTAPVPGSSGRKASTVAQIWNPANPTFSTSMLALAVILKQPATIALPVTPSFDAAPSTGFLNYVGTGEGNRGWHAVQVLGYVSNSSLPAALPKGAGGGWFVVKNSWGACWKDAGYIYLPFDWVKNYVGSASLIQDVL